MWILGLVSAHMKECERRAGMDLTDKAFVSHDTDKEAGAGKRLTAAAVKSWITLVEHFIPCTETVKDDPGRMI